MGAGPPWIPWFLFFLILSWTDIIPRVTNLYPFVLVLLFRFLPSFMKHPLICFRGRLFKYMFTINRWLHKFMRFFRKLNVTTFIVSTQSFSWNILYKYIWSVLVEPSMHDFGSILRFSILGELKFSQGNELYLFVPHIGSLLGFYRVITKTNEPFSSQVLKTAILTIYVNFLGEGIEIFYYTLEYPGFYFFNFEVNWYFPQSNELYPFVAGLVNQVSTEFSWSNSGQFLSKLKYN